MGIIGHMIGSAIGVFFRVIFFGIIGAAIGAGATLAVSMTMAGGHWPPSTLTDVIGVVVALLAGYAFATTIIVRALVGGALTIAKDAEQDIKKVV